VYVCVLESRHQHAAAQIDDRRAAADERADVVVAADSKDFLPADRHGLRPATGGGHLVHGAADEGDVGRPAGAGSIH